MAKVQSAAVVAAVAFLEPANWRMSQLDDAGGVSYGLQTKQEHAQKPFGRASLRRKYIALLETDNPRLLLFLSVVPCWLICVSSSSA